MSYADTDRLYGKFVVFQADGPPLEHPPTHHPGGWFAYRGIDRSYHLPIEGPWFVLCYGRDPHARAALATYADSVERELPGLARDIRDTLAELDRADAERVRR